MPEAIPLLVSVVFSSVIDHTTWDHTVQFTFLRFIVHLISEKYHTTSGEMLCEPLLGMLGAVHSIFVDDTKDTSGT